MSKFSQKGNNHSTSAKQHAGDEDEAEIEDYKDKQ